MVDRQALRRTIEKTPRGEDAAVVTRSWLEEVERDLAELADRRARDGSQVELS